MDEERERGGGLLIGVDTYVCEGREEGRRALMALLGVGGSGRVSVFSCVWQRDRERGGLFAGAGGMV